MFFIFIQNPDFLLETRFEAHFAKIWLFLATFDFYHIQTVSDI